MATKKPEGGGMGRGSSKVSTRYNTTKTKVGKTERKVTNSERKMLDRMVKDAVKRGATKYSAGSLKDGVRKPSVASKANAQKKAKDIMMRRNP